jgi:hypothetical protein
MGAAGEIAFFEPDVAEHPFDDSDVLWFSTMRRTRHCKLLVTPTERIKTAGAEKRDYLEGFGAGSPIGKGVRVTCGTHELIALSDHRGVDPMLRLGFLAACDRYIELVRLHYIKEDSGASTATETREISRMDAVAGSRIA